MKKTRILAFALGAVVIVFAAAVAGLAFAPIAPPTQTVATAIPDAQIPR